MQKVSEVPMQPVLGPHTLVHRYLYSNIGLLRCAPLDLRALVLSIIGSVFLMAVAAYVC